MKNELKYFLIGMIGANLAWAINYMLPYSQGAYLIKNGINAFWMSAYICFIPLFCMWAYDKYNNSKLNKENSKQ